MGGMRRGIVGFFAIALIAVGCGGPTATTPPSSTGQPTSGSGQSTSAPTTETTTGATREPTAQPTPSTPLPPTPEPTPAKPTQTGKGVTVVIFDRGIDYTHPDFLNADGTTRVKAALDMSMQNDWCTAGRAQPVEYSEQQINDALTSGTWLPIRDAVGHGTATAGLAAGNGSALPDHRYAGVAPEADLVIVKITSEGAPTHGGLPAEQPFNACLDDALAWADGKINELGQPAVGIWNAGSQWGPIDGTSASSASINHYWPPNTPGRVFVVTAGDEGGIPNHAGADYGPDSAASIPFQVKGPSSFPTAWYSGNAPAKVTVELTDGTVVGPVGPGESVDQDGVAITQYAPGSEFYPWTSTSGDRAVTWYIAGHQGATGQIKFEATGNAAGHVDVYGDVLGQETLTSNIDFGSGLVDGRISDPGSTTGVIVAGVYVALDSFVNVSGAAMDFSAEGVTGDLWYRSSGGPTRDGRDAVDVTAAGQNVAAPLGPSTSWNTPTYRDLLPQAGEGQYIRFGGTSAAGPIIVGTVALMLQANPALTTDAVREILHSTATADEFTGSVPNPDWGYGKLDILAAVAAASQ